MIIKPNIKYRVTLTEEERETGGSDSQGENRRV